MNTVENKQRTAAGDPRYVRPFEVGDWVEYRNHVLGYFIFRLKVEEIKAGIVTAERLKGQRFTFHAETGIATWSSNLSIDHWPNDKLRCEGTSAPTTKDNL